MSTEQLQLLSQFFKANNRPQLAQTLRRDLLSKLPNLSSQQFLSFCTNNPPKQFQAQPSIRSLPNKKPNSSIINKIIYSPKLLNNHILNDKANRLLGTSLYQKTLNRIIKPVTSSKPSFRSQEYSIPCFSQIQQYTAQGEEQYHNDIDLGYHQYVFQLSELSAGCAQLTKMLGYPSCAIYQSHQKPFIPAKSKIFPQHIQFPTHSFMQYPLTHKGLHYDALPIQIIYDRERTGYEQEKELKFKSGDLLVGRYVVQQIMGSGVFASVLRVHDSIKNEQCCFKMVSNNKDFFDQAIDQIKLLRYIKNNCCPTQQHILQFKSVFYHKQHLFIETELLKDNLFTAYRKLPSLFTIENIKTIARNIFKALLTLHNLKIVHSDIKPQNILIRSYSPLSVVVIDLGNSCFNHDNLGSYVQSRSYRAPEVVLGLPYDFKIDVWSIGCILAELWTKNVLFYNVNVAGMLAKIQSIVGPWPAWMLEAGSLVSNHFSKENLIFIKEEQEYRILVPKKTSLKNRIRTNHTLFLSFLRQLLEIDPNKRLSAEQALNHQFLKE